MDTSSVADPRGVPRGSTAQEADLAVLRLRLEAVNLRGLAQAADALLGEHPAAVCEALASWDLTRSGGLPRLVDRCWAALAPLGVGVPTGPAPRVLEGLLAGISTEARIALDALEDCWDYADRIPVHAAGDALGAELWRRALVSALDDFWSLMRDACAHLRHTVLGNDYAETTRFLKLEGVRLTEAADRIEALATCVATAGGASSPPAFSASLGQPEQAPALPAPAFVDRRPQASAEDMRRWLPIAFLVAVTGLAIVVLVVVASSAPPG